MMPLPRCKTKTNRSSRRTKNTARRVPLGTAAALLAGASGILALAARLNRVDHHPIDHPSTQDQSVEGDTPPLANRHQGRANRETTFEATNTPTDSHHSHADKRNGESIDHAARAAGANNTWLAKVTQAWRKEQLDVRMRTNTPLCRAYRHNVAGWRALGAWARQALPGGPGLLPGNDASCDSDIGGPRLLASASSPGHGWVSYFLHDAIAVVPEAPNPHRNAPNRGRLFPLGDTTHPRADAGTAGDGP